MKIKVSDKIVTVSWYDAETKLEVELVKMIEEGLPIKETYGKIIYVGKNENNIPFVIIQTEVALGDEVSDFTILPKSLIINIK